MPLPPAPSKNESWARAVQSFGKYPDTQHWNQWRSVIEPVITRAIQAGYDGLLRAACSMHDVLVFTSDYIGSEPSPHVKISVTEDWQILVQYLPGIYSKGAILAPTIPSHTVESGEAFQILTRYLQHLWTETVPEPIPEILRRH